MLERLLYNLPDLDKVHAARGTPNMYDGVLVDDEHLVDTLEESNLVSSEVINRETGNVEHAVTIDIDHPARLVPSSTPGHFHLFIDVTTDWNTYEALLFALAAAGVIEDGYVSACQNQGKTLLRTKPRPIAYNAPEEKF